VGQTAGKAGGEGVGERVGERIAWTLTNASEPAVTRDSTPTAAALKSAEAKPLGHQTFGLVSVDAVTKSGAVNGRKVEARGLLYRDGAYADLNLTSIKPVSSDCTK
jgi:hypothetical protein